VRSWFEDELFYLGPSQYVRHYILAALLRMPDDVANFAANRCFFTSLGGPGDIHALTLPPNVAGDRWMIALLESSADDPEESMTTVAEEVAHAWLGHRYEDGSDEFEAAASAQVRQWGFKGGTTADPRRCRQRLTRRGP
jgi:hypothetical protein